MNEILIDTHREENIELLKACDYYFDKAKKQNKWKNRIIQIPAYLLIFAYVVLFGSYFIQKQTGINAYDIINGIFEAQLDLVIGIITIGAFFVGLIYDKAISKNKDISNMLREEYDVRVFKMERNIFAYGNAEKKFRTYLEKAKYVKDYYKYEVWYSEIFSEEREKNVLCCQMDNIIYTYHVYGNMYKAYLIKFGIYLVVMALTIFVSWKFQLAHPFLVFLAFFDVLETIWGEIDTCSEMKEKNEELKKVIDGLDADKLTQEELKVHLRCLQDCVINNRNSSLFAPKRIRDKYLEEGNPYYVELDSVKEKFLGGNCSMPECAEDLCVLSMDETKQTGLVELQKRLYKILCDVTSEFEKNEITYTLDGGTLLGAVRKNMSGCEAEKKLPKARWGEYLIEKGGKFLFWDDDVDLAVPVEQLERAKQILREKLGDIYALQDYETEEYYSPRLSNLRVRELNAESRVAEKDSVLWEKYTEQGIFIDIYAYAPILYNIFVDKLFRFLFIHPLHRMIKKVEESWKYSDDSTRAEVRFKELKQKYLRRVEWYLQHAKNDAYYSYVPNYIDNLKKAGPYFKKEHLYGTVKYAEFETEMFRVPSEPAEILAGCYGNEWYKSPFSKKEDLLKYGANWFSKVEHMTSVYKHVKRADI